MPAPKPASDHCPLSRRAENYRPTASVKGLTEHPLTDAPTNSLEYSTLTSDGEAVYGGLTLTGWVKIGIVTLLMVATFRFSLVRLWLKTNPFSGEEDWRHAIVVPLIALYYLYYSRDILLKTVVKPSWLGMAILGLGLFIFAYGIYPGQNDMVKDGGMVITLFGVVAMLCGWQIMKIAWFPIVFLSCAIPWSPLVYQMVADPLQKMAADVGVHVLNFCNVQAQLVEGTTMTMQTSHGPASLEVAQACAGLRSLMSFVSVGGAIAFLSSRPLWQKLVIVASAIPTAIFCNVMRVSGCGLLEAYASHDFSLGFAHQFVGLIMLIPGFFVILGIAWIFDKMFIDEADRKLLKRVAATPNTSANAQRAPVSSAPQAAPSPTIVKRRAPAAAPVESTPNSAAAAVAKAARALSSKRSEGK